MVPGFTERERRAAERQRLELLAEVVIGPRKLTPARSQQVAITYVRTVQIGLWRRGIAAARLLGCRVGLASPLAIRKAPANSAESVR